MSMIAAMFIHRATIQRDAPVQDPDTKAWTSNLTTVAANVRCRMRSLKLAEQMIAAQRTPMLSHRLYFAPTQDVKSGDVITCNGALLRVETINTPSQPGSHIEVDCAQMPPAIVTETQA